MTEDSEFIARLEQPITRRSWLFLKALEALPFDKAIDFARAADEFISSGSQHSACATESRAARDQIVVNGADGSNMGRFVEETTVVEKASTNEAMDHVPRNTLTPRDLGCPINTAVRARLIDRLARGAKNAELAAEFGLSPKQVQGVRLGCSREITRQRRDADSQSHRVAASIDDVIRYLRQQDDVVVRQGTGEFLVNARFRMSAAQLGERANRIRVRQGKPEFELGSHLVDQSLSTANGRALHDTSGILVEA